MATKKMYKVYISTPLRVITYQIDTRRDHLIQVPSYMSGPVCDSCNSNLPEDFVWLLVLGLHVWGALCDNCVAKYWSKLPKYRLDLSTGVAEPVTK